MVPLDNPVINVSTGNLSVNIIGAPGFTNDYNYQSAVVTLQPLNGFLLNVLWLNYDQIDPTVAVAVRGREPWRRPPRPMGTSGPGPRRPPAQLPEPRLHHRRHLDRQPLLERHRLRVWEPAFLNVETADPSEDWYEDGGGCSGNPTGDTPLTSALANGSTYTTLRSKPSVRLRP